MIDFFVRAGTGRVQHQWRTHHGGQGLGGHFVPFRGGNYQRQVIQQEDQSRLQKIEGYGQPLRVKIEVTLTTYPVRPWQAV